MASDLSSLKSVFFEEASDSIERIESTLLDGEFTSEAINDIFRAAHSIKGAAGMFELRNIAEFTHHLETLLDQVRSGARPFSDDIQRACLASVDVLRELLEIATGGADGGTPASAQLLATIIAMSKGEVAAAPAPAATPAAAEPAPVPAGPSTWTIRIAPSPDLFASGHDPLRLLRELGKLGEMTVACEVGELVALDAFDPGANLLAWTVTLVSDGHDADIAELLEWVEDWCSGACDRPAAAAVATPPAAPAEHAEAVAAPPPAAGPAVAEPPPAAAAAERNLQLVADAGTPARGRAAARDTSSTSIRVGIDKIDALINMVGELVITQSMLSRFSEDFAFEGMERLRDGLAQLERNTRELQETVLTIRMLPISFCFNRFPRLVHDVSAQIGKRVELIVRGEQTELDKTVLEKITDPLVHLVRNCLDHGIEAPDVRELNGKDPVGKLILEAYHHGGSIIIEIRDDGRGLNTEAIRRKAVERGLLAPDDPISEEQAAELIFHAGFSTAEKVTDLSGRGVGMDVVRRNIKDLGGEVEVRSVQGKGTTFRVKLPLTLAILDGQLVRVGNQTYIVPLVAIVESLQVRHSALKTLQNQNEILRLRDELIPIAHLDRLFNLSGHESDPAQALIVVVEGDGHKVGLMVDDLLGQQQVVIKSLETNYRRVEGISGATILGDGTVALILDVAGILTLSGARNAVAA